LAQHAKRLGRLSEYADVSVEHAKIVANGLRGAGIGFMGVGVGVAKATAASSAATAAYQGVAVDLVVSGGVLTLLSIATTAFTLKFKKQKLLFKYNIEDIKAFISRLRGEPRWLREGRNGVFR
jgi:hypothetical protein